jgi:predicted enzyme related to lactoylglutathione lyase
MVYTTLQKGGKNVCGLYEMNSEMIQQGIPPHWASYVSVESADRGANKVREFGGTVVMPPMDVMDVGRMTVVQDPTGAVFSLWEPRQHIGADIIYDPGALGWNELVTKDPPAASRFYSGVFGWSENKMKGPAGEDYTEFKLGEQPAGGMLEIKQEWGEVPPNWAVYFCVADCDATLQKAGSLGASMVLPTMEVENIRFAFLKDPQDVYFGIAQVK